MPIGQFLNGENFDPETTRVMGVAFELACVALQLRNRSDPATSVNLKQCIRAAADHAEMMEERGEPFLLPLPCDLPYALQRL